MRKLAIVLALVLLVVGIFGVAALTSLEIDRDVTYQVTSDTAANVAVKFDVTAGYEDVAYLLGDAGETNEIFFELAGVLEDGVGTHFNPEATFIIGEEVDGNGVFTITNQTDSGIDVGLASTAEYIELITTGGGAPGAGEVAQWGVSTLTIASGDHAEFYFSLDTTDALVDGANPPLADADLSTTLVIREEGGAE